MRHRDENVIGSTLQLGAVMGFLAYGLWNGRHPTATTVPGYFGWFLLGAGLILCWAIYRCVERKLLAQLIVAGSALAVLPALMVAPMPFSARTFWISLLASCWLVWFAFGPIRLLDTISAVVIVPFVWLDCSALSNNSDLRFIFQTAIFIASAPLVWRFLYWRLRYGALGNVPDPENE